MSTESEAVSSTTWRRGSIASFVASIPLLVALGAVGVDGVDGVDETDAEDVSDAAVEVVFFDVGEGDSASLITLEEKPRVIVIDGGYMKTARKSLIPYLKARGVEVIDLVIASHADEDHISGLVPLLQEEHFTIKEIWDPGYPHESELYRDKFPAAVKASGARYYCPLGKEIVATAEDDLDDEKDRCIRLGYPERFGALEIIPLHTNDRPSGSSSSYRSNGSSIVVKVRMGDNSILFTGDATGRSEHAPPDQPEETCMYTEAALLDLEEELRERKPSVLRSTILKVPHHGSLTSSCDQFLAAVRPHWVVVSSGIGSHGLPKLETLTRYGAIRANILRTDAADEIPETDDDHLFLELTSKARVMIWGQVGTPRLLEIARGPGEA